MKTRSIAMLLVLAGLYASPLIAQTHSVTLTWTAPPDATPSSTISIFRFTGTCANATFTTPLVTGLPVDKPYVDTTVGVGTYCFTTHHVLNGANSINSNLASTTVSPLPATQLTVK
jgi:hypothetical protein